MVDVCQKNMFVDVFNVDGILVFSFIRHEFKSKARELHGGYNP